MQSLTAEIAAIAPSLASRLTEIRRALHRRPELSLEERQTTAAIREWLEEAAISLLPLPLPTGVLAEVRGALPGPVIAIRADIDALPIHEETGLPFASGSAGKMHACGHDFHTATALGAALILQQLRPSLAGTVRFLFQPAEEIAGGATPMIEAGALDGVQAIFGLHNKPDLRAGHIGLLAGPLMAAVDTIAITVTGKGGHAAIPDATVDPIVAAAAIVSALQTAVSRSVSPLDAAVVSIGSFQAGTAHNIIPATAHLTGTVRTFRPEVRDRLGALLQRIVQNVAAGYGAVGELSLSPDNPPVINDPAAVELVRQSAERLGLTVVEAERTTASEDFSRYQQVIPGCFFWLGTGNPDPADAAGCLPRPNWHHPQFDVDESVMERGAALFAQVAIDALGAYR